MSRNDRTYNQAIKAEQQRMRLARGINRALANVFPCHDGFEVSELFDTHQTHSVADFREEELPEVKAALKEIGLNKFRKVKNWRGRYVLCFNAENFNFEDPTLRMW